METFSCFPLKLNPFLSHPEYNSTLNDEVMDEQFLFGYCAGKNTLLKNTYQVNPGEYLELSKGKLNQKYIFVILINKKMKLILEMLYMR